MTTQTKPRIHIVIENDQPITTSRNVAENFDKRHDSVLRDIDNLKESFVGSPQNWGDLFHETVYTHEQNKQQYREYYMTKDGFTLLAMGFTGKKALEFKLAYIDQFNKMEEQAKQQLDTAQLSPELQMFGNLYKAIANQELETKRLENKVDGISDIVALNTIDWRTDSQNLINRIVRIMGNTTEAHREIRNEIFKEVDRRGGVKLNIRLTNKRRRMADEGVSKSKRDRLTKVDVIADDKKLIEIYVAIVKEYAIKYGVEGSN